MSLCIEWSHGVAYIERVGAMCAPVRFILDNGETIEPFAVFPWADEATPPGETRPTGLLARGRGEWPCVPFGYEDAARDLPADILALCAKSGEAQDPPHGLPSHQEWQLDELMDGCAKLSFYFPDDHQLYALRRTIKGVSGKATLEFSLTIEARCPCQLPIGLHPTFTLPQYTHAMQIVVEEFAYGQTYPCVFEKGASITKNNLKFNSLDRVPHQNGDAVDLSRLPLEMPFEDAVLLRQTNGCVKLLAPEEGYQIDVKWPADILPDVMLWMSCGGRQYYPWSGRHYGLGVEPVCSAFDLGERVSQHSNPFNQQGEQTTQALNPQHPLTFSYTIAASSL